MGRVPVENGKKQEARVLAPSILSATTTPAYLCCSCASARMYRLPLNLVFESTCTKALPQLPWHSALTLCEVLPEPHTEVLPEPHTEVLIRILLPAGSR